MSADTPTFRPWQSRPVFISSTFLDMQAERDYLQSHVFPRLGEELRKRQHHLSPIDLRVGVETTVLDSEHEREMLVLKVCLAEITRSRPFMIVLIGDRYGWVPPVARMDAAIQEVDFDTATSDKSVTALEIEFGAFMEHADQRRRTHFYFRDPLPYDQMDPEVAARYSDAYSSDPEVRAQVPRLDDLKERIETHPEFTDRRHQYRVTWDEGTQRVTGIKTLGDMIFDHLWADLEEETRAIAAQPAQTWEDLEREASLEFVEQHARDFTGRQDLLEQLLSIARAPVDVPMPESGSSPATWGACLTGAPGTGKSAIIAELYAKLSADDSLLLLINAAGATPRGDNIDSMLRRFIGEMATALSIDNPLADDAGPDDVDAAFTSLLAQVALHQPVVVLLDALDQFDANPRGQHMSWLRPERWPANARLIATSLPGATPARVLSDVEGVEECEVPGLDDADIINIGRRIFARYHRQPNMDTVGIIARKEKPDASLAARNPLWLILALEHINLLDADDFARAEKEFTGSSAERLRDLIADTALRMPPDVSGLYDWMLANSEKAYGEAFVRAFAAAVALSRTGWRESDLLVLVPKIAEILISGESVDTFDELQLAAIRRGFQAHLCRRGVASQLDFFHQQMRVAVEKRVTGDTDLQRAMHIAIADHLESIHATDPLRESEFMVHLIGGDDSGRAAKLLADPEAPPGTISGSVQTLAGHIALGGDPEQNPALAWVVGLLVHDSLTPGESACLAGRFNFELHSALINVAEIGPRKIVAHGARATLSQLAESKPDDYEVLRQLAVSLDTLGNLAVLQGKLDEARDHFDGAKAITERLLPIDPINTRSMDDLATSLTKLGDSAVANGDLEGALHHFVESLELRKRTSAINPDNLNGQFDLTISINKIGDVAYWKNNLDEAERLFELSLSIREQLVELDSQNVEWQRGLSVTLNRLGDVALSQGDRAQAIRRFRKGLQVAERLVARNPQDALWQSDLATSFDRLGDLASSVQDFEAAAEYFAKVQSITTEIAANDPQHVQWQANLGIVEEKLGKVAGDQGDFHKAGRHFAESLRIRERLATDPDDAQAQQHLYIAYWWMADVTGRIGDPAQAKEYWQKAYDTLNGLKQRGVQLSIEDERYLAQLEERVNPTVPRQMATVIEQMAEANPQNTEWAAIVRHSLWISANRCFDDGEFEDAKDRYNQYCAALMELLQKNPKDVELRGKLAESLTKLGEIAVQLDDPDEAMKMFTLCSYSREHAAESEPDDEQIQRKLWLSYGQLVLFCRKNNDLHGANEWLSKEYGTLAEMKRRGMQLTKDEVDVVEMQERSERRNESRVARGRTTRPVRKPGRRKSRTRRTTRDDQDERYTDAVRAVIESGEASISMLRQQLHVGYTRAARLIDELERNGIIGPQEGRKPRAILVEGIPADDNDGTRNAGD